jgi:hypothetical protein
LAAGANATAEMTADAANRDLFMELPLVYATGIGPTRERRASRISSETINDMFTNEGAAIGRLRLVEAKPAAEG